MEISYCAEKRIIASDVEMIGILGLTVRGIGHLKCKTFRKVEERAVPDPEVYNN